MPEKEEDINDYGICVKCQHFQLVKFKGANKFKKDCSEVEIKNTPAIKSCSKFFDRKWTNLSMLCDIAWNIDPKKKESIGFLPPDPIKSKPLHDPITGYEFYERL